MRKLIDEKGRLGGKLSVIDLVIILLILVVVIGAYMNLFVLTPTTITIEAAPVRYTLQISHVREWAMHNIRAGDALFSAGTYVGTIQSVRAEPFETLVQSESHAWWGEVPARYTVFVEVLATATVTDGRFMVSRAVSMGIGNSAAPLTTRYADFSATLTEIELYEQ